jgi:lipopolysaccharide transport system permease protein
VLIPLLLLTLGISWGLAALGVYFRDISQFIGILTTALLFLSPIFYSITSLPANFQTIMMANPLTPIIEQSRNVLLWGVIPDFALLSWYFIVAALVAVVGFAGFQKIRKGFADVI